MPVNKAVTNTTYKKTEKTPVLEYRCFLRLFIWKWNMGYGWYGYEKPEYIWEEYIKNGTWTSGRARNMKNKNKELWERCKNWDIVVCITKKRLEMRAHVVRMDHRRLVKKNLRLKWREEEEWEDLNWDVWRMLKRIYERWNLRDGDRWQWMEKNGRL